MSRQTQFMSPDWQSVPSGRWQLRPIVVSEQSAARAWQSFSCVIALHSGAASHAVIGRQVR